MKPVACWYRVWWPCKLDIHAGGNLIWKTTSIILFCGHVYEIFCCCFLSCWHKLDSLGKEELQWLPPSDWHMDITQDIFLFREWCRNAQPTINGASPGQLALGCIGKCSELAVENNAVSIILRWFFLRSCFHNPFLNSRPDFPWWWAVSWKI